MNAAPGGEERADEEGCVIATRERRERTVSRGFQILGSRGGDAPEHREPERAAHHERGVHYAVRARASLGLTSPVAASSTGLKAMQAPAEQDHAWKHVDDKVAVDRGPREEQEPDRRHAKADREWEPDAEAHDEPRRDSDRERHRHDVARQEGEPDLERAVAQDELDIEGPRGRTRRTSPRPIARRRRWRSRGSAGGRARAGRAASPARSLPGQRRIPLSSRRSRPEVPGCSRQSPQRQGLKALLLHGIPAYPRSARKPQDRPVTPEVAGSSPVAPVALLSRF
jgi:hypothetical protein